MREENRSFTRNGLKEMLERVQLAQLAIRNKKEFQNEDESPWNSQIHACYAPSIYRPYKGMQT